MSANRTYRAPTQHGEAFTEPSWSGAVEAISQNQSLAASWDVTLGAQSLQQLRTVARDELIRDAVHYSRTYREVERPVGNEAIVMAGHQPTLFHPGVWFKNFALDRVTRQLAPDARSEATTLAADHAGSTNHRGRPEASAYGSLGRGPSLFRDGGAGFTKNEYCAINLVIDNDVASSPSIRVPVIGQADGLVRQDAIAYDAVAGGVPYEQNRIRDRELFESFDARVVKAIAPIVAQPLVSRLWTHARAAASRCENVSCAFAQARHALEGELGLQTLELPLSVVCRSESFAAFAISILSELPRFRQIYNESIQRYRREHSIRSKAHPVPELAVQGEWIEAPFWIYGDDSPQRCAAWVRRLAGTIEISDLAKRSVRLTSPLGSTGLATELSSHNGPNWKLRPRALMTTMYARLILSDLFVHGIGGATYDQLGDQIMRRYFGIAPPVMMVVSATVHLPMASMVQSQESVEQVKRQLRGIQFAPERFADEADLAPSLVDRKQQLIGNIPSRGNKRAWHLELTEVNRLLETQLREVRTDLELRLLIAKKNVASTAILRSREFSFCLFDLEMLRETFAEML